ncbi:cation diffusion facilitator family transporter [Caballeronia sordidicola]|uniref:Cation diffusion facilitator family transporter n=1 Tax=Caballeronia sordidicola TaxID=196367 RepID=A0A158IDM9_CABSO|nr:CDF family Co(II)/Ni(II) efflux transporter DmeF [Caballeronia sordidicola]SAL54685.1 cation diffusion facilitator family transporter [Caballeronia sordidicola]
MSKSQGAAFSAGHDHIFLGAAHEQNERRTWAVITLCSAMMLAEIAGGNMFGSLALVADGMHMSTHAGAMLIAALAYTYARKHVADPRFVFGTGKLGDLAGFTSAIALAMVAVIIGYEAMLRFLSPVTIHFEEAIPIAAVGLIVNTASVWLLGGYHHGHEHNYAHSAGHSHGKGEHAREDEARMIFAPSGTLTVSLFEDGVTSVFRITPSTEQLRLDPSAVSVTAIWPDGTRQVFAFADHGGYLQSKGGIPEPHAFKAIVRVPEGEHAVEFDEHDADVPNVATRDHNIRSAYIHVVADVAVSVLAIIGLVLARAFDWLWMDPLAGILGALVIANWSYGLIRDTGSILLDMNPDRRMAENVRHAIEDHGDQVIDLHIWRVGPGHMSAVVSVATRESQRDSRFYHAVLKRFKGLSHLTVEVQRPREAN